MQTYCIFNRFSLCYLSTNFDAFRVQNCESFSIVIANNFFRVTVLLLTYFYNQFFARTPLKSINYFRFVSQTTDVEVTTFHKPQTHRTVSEISPETAIHRLSLSICKDLLLKCFKRRCAQELTDANCAARMKCAKVLLQNFPQSATDFVFFTDENVFSVASPDNRQNKVSGRLRELLKKKFSVFFGASTVRSSAAWPPVNCACVPQLSEQLCPPFLEKFVWQALCCILLQIQTF